MGNFRSRKSKLHTDQRWRDSYISFPKITQRDENDRIIEARIGGVLSCPLCPNNRPMAGLSNLVGHLISKDHFNNLSFITMLARHGDENAKAWQRFYYSWESGNDLYELAMERVANSSKINRQIPKFDLEELKEKYNFYADFRQEIANQPSSESSSKVQSLRKGRTDDRATDATSNDVSSGIDTSLGSAKGKAASSTNPPTTTTVTASEKGDNAKLGAESSKVATLGPKLGHFATPTAAPLSRLSLQNQVTSSFKQMKSSETGKTQSGEVSSSDVMDLVEVGKKRKLLPEEDSTGKGADARSPKKQRHQARNQSPRLTQRPDKDPRQYQNNGNDRNSRGPRGDYYRNNGRDHELNDSRGFTNNRSRTSHSHRSSSPNAYRATKAYHSQRRSRDNTDHTQRPDHSSSR